MTKEEVHSDGAEQDQRSPRPPLCRYSGNGWRGEVVAGSVLHQWLLGGGRPEEIPSRADFAVRTGSRSHCFRIARLDDDHPLPTPLFFKAYRRRPGAKAWLKRAVGWHMPPWVWSTSWTLIAAGLPVPQPWGYLTPLPLQQKRMGCLWTEWIDGAVRAMNFGLDAEKRHVVASDWYVRGAADVLAKLHNAGYFHRDMNWGNLLLDPHAGRMWLVDLDSAHRMALNRRAAADRDVARFLLDAVRFGMPPDWLTSFFDHYASKRGMAPNPLAKRVQPMVDEFFRRRAVRYDEEPPAAALSAIRTSPDRD